MAEPSLKHQTHLSLKPFSEVSDSLQEATGIIPFYFCLSIPSTTPYPLTAMTTIVSFQDYYIIILTGPYCIGAFVMDFFFLSRSGYVTLAGLELPM